MWALRSVVPAVLTIALANLVARVVVPGEPVHQIPDLPFSRPLLLWPLLIGPVVGVCAYGFAQLMAARGRARRGNALLVTVPAAFLCVGLLAMPFPQILGNGKGPAEAAFTARPSLAGLRPPAVADGRRRPVPAGRRLRKAVAPSFASGALLGTVAGRLWELMWPGTVLAAYAAVTAGAFLAVPPRMPVTAIVLALEYTGGRQEVVIPLLLGVAGATAKAPLLRGREKQTGRHKATDSPTRAGRHPRLGDEEAVRGRFFGVFRRTMSTAYLLSPGSSAVDYARSRGRAVDRDGGTVAVPQAIRSGSGVRVMTCER